MLSRFFIKCSGANNKILKEVPPDYLETEQTKFEGIGGAIFFTSFLAFISCSFALSTIVKDIHIGNWIIPSLIISLSFGFVWALMIFNLDRYIVSSMRKKGNLKGEIIHAIPRILIALLFATVISKPLELEIFRTEIEAQLPNSANEQTLFLKNKIDSLSIYQQKLKSENDTLRENPYKSAFVQNAEDDLNLVSSEYDSLAKILNPKINQLSKNISDLQGQFKDANGLITEYNREIRNIENKIKEFPYHIDNPQRKIEITQLERKRYPQRLRVNRLPEEIKSLKEERKGYKDELKKIEDEIGLKSNELSAQKSDIEVLVKAQIEKNKITIEEVETEIKSTAKERQKLKAMFTGLLARLKALEDLKGKKGNFVIYLASTLVFLIFLAIETAPIFVKLISNQTLYDQILEEFEKPLPNKELIKAKVGGFYEEDALRISQEKIALREFYKEKLKIQQKFFEKSLKQIKENENKKFNKNKQKYANSIVGNPKKYINSFDTKSKLSKNKEGELEWDKDLDLVDENLSKDLKTKLIIAGAILLFIALIFGGVRYFSGLDEAENEPVKADTINTKEVEKSEKVNLESLDTILVGEGNENIEKDSMNNMRNNNIIESNSAKDNKVGGATKRPSKESPPVNKSKVKNKQKPLIPDSNLNADIPTGTSTTKSNKEVPLEEKVEKGSGIDTQPNKEVEKALEDENSKEKDEPMNLPKPLPDVEIEISNPIEKDQKVEEKPSEKKVSEKEIETNTLSKKELRKRERQQKKEDKKNKNKQKNSNSGDN